MLAARCCPLPPSAFLWQSNLAFNPSILSCQFCRHNSRCDRCLLWDPALPPAVLQCQSVRVPPSLLLLSCSASIQCDVSEVRQHPSVSTHRVAPTAPQGGSTSCLAPPSRHRIPAAPAPATAETPAQGPRHANSCVLLSSTFSSATRSLQPFSRADLTCPPLANNRFAPRFPA